MSIRVLITDDSAFMRSAIKIMVKDDPTIVVVGEARDGRSAVQMVETLQPDVITMDVEMPGMDGLAATKEIMERFPRPIIMLSSLTERGAETTLKALELGAVDFIPKKSSFVQLDIVQISSELLEKIRYWGKRSAVAGIGRGAVATNAAVTSGRAVISGFRPELVVIGLSTGGPAAMPKLLKAMGRLSCPTVVAQHMPAQFTPGFAGHLKADSGLNVLEAYDGLELQPGMIAIAPGGADTVVRETLPGRLFTYIKTDTAMPIHPSVDALFSSAARLRRKVAAAILTGMGSDGALGARELFARQQPVLAQEPSECVVDGMPSSAISAGVVNEVLTVDGIGRKLKKWAGA
jgi:two-component system, chemotaxis family, protein-glutamate methylesterase/glutaminase